MIRSNSGKYVDRTDDEQKRIKTCGRIERSLRSWAQGEGGAFLVCSHDADIYMASW